MKQSYFFLILTLCYTSHCIANPEVQNQTDTVNTPLFEESLPYTLRLETNTLSLPTTENLPNTYLSEGINGCAYATKNGKWVFVGGRATGLHGLHGKANPFPPHRFNRVVYVVDINNQTVSYRPLSDPKLNIPQYIIDILSVTNPTFFQSEGYLHIMGGYGYDFSTQTFGTKNTLTRINIKKLIEWTEEKTDNLTDHITIDTHDTLQITGSAARNTQYHEPTLLCLGHNFQGDYQFVFSGTYPKEIRPLYIPSYIDKGVLSQTPLQGKDSNYRRRDYNCVPIIHKKQGRYNMRNVALAGVFTPTTGAWTVPIFVNADGSSYMLNPNNPQTFKQGMTSYESAFCSLYSEKTNETFAIIFGGISFLYYEDGEFKTDFALPFDGAITTIKIDENDFLQQYLMNTTFPDITYPNLDTKSYFGANAIFIPAYSKKYPNYVLALDTIPSNQEILIGYIIGGIQSSARETGRVPGATKGSTYIFNVYLTKK